MTTQAPYRERFIWGHDTVPLGNTALRHALRAIGPRGGRVLEVGCGAGRFVRTIDRARPDLEMHGVDLGPKSIRLATQYDHDAPYTLASATALPYATGSFDTVLLFDVLEHIPHAGPAIAVAEIARVLKPGGVFHALVPCEGQPGTLFWRLWKTDAFGLGDLKQRHGDHVQRFTRHDVRALVKANGLVITDERFSMHAIGQVKDVLTYVQREPWFRARGLDTPLFALLMRALWIGGYLEARLLERLESGAAVVHLTAVKP
ncbi:MAG: class I SAM-dependent methyltransferase [Dehalococcoidia bacterium]|nr:class I SAM-dependent methyltransferase [Dehalococcoidia bacterium]